MLPYKFPEGGGGIDTDGGAGVGGAVLDGLRGNRT